MGCCGSNPNQFYSSIPDGNALKAVADKLEIDPEAASKLYFTFAEIDGDNSGEVSVMEFLAHFSIDRTPFSLRVFSLLDADGSGKLSLKEFVCSFWNYCTFDWEALVRYSFRIFDEDGGGELDMSEIRALVEMMYISGSSDAIQKILNKMDKDQSGTVSLDEFKASSRKFPMLMYPAFTMQNRLREGVCGIAFWEKLSERRNATYADAPMLEVMRQMNAAKGQAQKALLAMKMKDMVDLKQQQTDLAATKLLKAEAKAKKRRQRLMGDRAAAPTGDGAAVEGKEGRDRAGGEAGGKKGEAGGKKGGKKQKRPASSSLAAAPPPSEPSPSNSAAPSHAQIKRAFSSRGGGGGGKGRGGGKGSGKGGSGSSSRRLKPLDTDVDSVGGGGSSTRSPLQSAASPADSAALSQRSLSAPGGRGSGRRMRSTMPATMRSDRRLRRQASKARREARRQASRGGGGGINLPGAAALGSGGDDDDDDDDSALDSARLFADSAAAQFSLGGGSGGGRGRHTLTPSSRRGRRSRPGSRQHHQRYVAQQLGLPGGGGSSMLSATR